MDRIDQFAVSLNVPDVGRAVGFYSALLDADPKAIERRVAWFDVPGSPLRIELRESSAPAATSLRICAEPSRVRAATARLRQTGVRMAESGLLRDGHPRAIALRDLGGNRLELCAPLAGATGGRVRPAGASRMLRSSAHRLRRLIAAGAIDERFDRERAREQGMLLRHGRHV